MDVSDEVRAAAKRIARWEACCKTGDIYEHEYFDEPDRQWNDESPVIDWAVARIEADDAEQAERARPIDEEWWSTNAGELGIWVHCDQCDYQIEPKFCGPGVCLSTWQHGASVAEVYLPNITTRGQLLDLYAALNGGDR